MLKWPFITENLSDPFLLHEDLAPSATDLMLNRGHRRVAVFLFVLFMDALLNWQSHNMI